MFKTFEIFIYTLFDAVNYGTRHVLVLADFPPRTRTIDLEKLFEDFNDHGVVIRWVNDTVALAVFRTPSIGIQKFIDSFQCNSS